MIIQLLFTALYTLLTLLFFWLPPGNLLPYGLDGLFVTVMGYFHGLIQTLPFLSVILQYAIYGVLFELGLLLVKAFLGSRAPGN